jgi:hypothetical protein
MLTIRSEQLAALAETQFDRVIAELRQYLRTHHAEATAHLDDDTLTHCIRIGVRRARSWGFDTLFGLGLFVALMFEVAPDFDTDPKIRKLLANPSLSLSRRLNGLETALTDLEWEQLSARADQRVWEA